MSSIRLSKSRIVSGLQCPKRLYLEVFQPELAEVDEHAQRVVQTGHRVGEIARGLWPDGHLVEHHQDLNDALAETRRMLRRSPQTSLFEATFWYGGVLVRVDILNGVNLIEVKASSRVKDYHLPDCAIQAWVLTGALQPVEQVQLAHVDTAFVYRGDGDYRGVLALEDITEQVQELVPQVPDWVQQCQATLAGSCPQREVGSHCHEPFECPFFAHCSPSQPDYPVTLLPYGGRVAAALLSEGIGDIRDIPEGRLGNPNHERIRVQTVRGEAELLPELPAFLATLPYPRYHLDFETIQFAVPVWTGTRPYQQLPFQWSCDVRHENGRLEHRDFLDTSGDNPLRACAEALVQGLGEAGPILVYSGFEKRIITELQGFFPDLHDALQQAIDRLIDLHPLVRANYYHPAQKGSWSIKQVLPTVVPDLSYDNLDGVNDGMAAQNAYLEMIDSATDARRSQELKDQLRAYCRLDTFAMVRMVETFTNVELSPEPARS